MIEPLPDELAQLIAAERTAPVTDAVAQAAVRAKLAIAVGHAPLGAAMIGVAGKVLAILAVVVGAGVGTKLLLDRSPGSSATKAGAQVSTSAVATASNAAVLPAEKAATIAIPPTVTASPSPHSLTAPSATTPAIVTHATAQGARVPTSATAASAPLAMTSPSAAEPGAVSLQPVDASTPTEAELLRQAWATRDASVALALVHRDAALHPDGALIEERIALEVRALADLHRTDEARAIATRFLISFPQTVHRAIVARALARKDTP